MNDEQLKPLTDEENVIIDELTAKWDKIITCTDRCDRKKVEEITCEVYKVNGFEPPKQFIWFESPIGVIKYGTKGYTTDEPAIYETLSESLYDCYLSPHSGGWFAFYEFAFNHRKIEEFKPLMPITELAKYSCWVKWLDDRAIFCERPTKIDVVLRGNELVLHNDKGEMAYQFSDGSGGYFVDSIYLPEHIGKVPVSEWTAKMALDEKNMEVRRLMLGKIPAEKFNNELNPTLIDVYTNPKTFSEYKLKEIVLEDQTREDEDGNEVKAVLKLLQYKCPSTGRDYCAKIPEEVKSAREAITLVNKGVDPEQFEWEA